MNDKEFAQEYQALLPYVYNYAMYICNNKQLAEDATAEAFVITYQYLKTKKILNLRAWLLRVVRNELMELLRKQKQTVSIDFSKVVSTSEEYDNELEYQRILKIIDEQLQPEIYKEVLLLKYKFELKYHEIAQIINKSEQNTRKIHERALTKLKDIL